MGAWACHIQPSIILPAANALDIKAHNERAGANPLSMGQPGLSRRQAMNWWLTAKETRFWWVSIAPLGVPVVPLV